MSAAGAVVLALAVLGAPGATRGFKAEVGRFLAAERTWGVLVRSDLPTTVVEVVDGDWRIADEAPVHEGSLPRGALVRVAAVRFAGLWVEAQVEGVEAAGSALLRFRLPFVEGTELRAEDARAARRYIERFVRLFRGEKAARAFAAGLPAPVTSK